MITLSSNTKSIELFQAQEDVKQTSGSPNVDSLYGFDSDETLITSLKSKQNFTLVGKTTGIRLSKKSSYSSDALTALAEWVVKLLTFVNGKQGGGYTLQDNDRSESVNGAVKSAGFQRARAAKYEVDWDLEFTVGDAVMEEQDTSSPSVSPSTSATLGGYDLGELRSFRETKRQKFSTTPIQFGDPQSMLIQPGGGATRRIIIVGRKSGSTSTRNTFDSNIEALVGQNQANTYSSAFPGRDLNVIVKDFEGTRDSGLTRLGDYTLELLEGTVV